VEIKEDMVEIKEVMVETKEDLEIKEVKEDLEIKVVKVVMVVTKVVKDKDGDLKIHKINNIFFEVINVFNNSVKHKV
jgi:hypothetical protein